MENKNYLLLASIIMILLTIYASLIYAPTVKDTADSTWSAPKVQRIFYFHMPFAIFAYLAFFIVFLSGILYLKKRDMKWDIIAFSSAEIGVVFCALGIILGIIWAKAEWDVYWDWGDMKLNTTLVLFLIYLAYLSIRGSIEEKEKRARLSAVYGIIGFAGVPLSYFSFYIWDEYLHSKVVSPGGGGLGSEMKITLIISMIAFLLLYFYLLLNRIELEKLSKRIEMIEERYKNERT